MPKSTAAEKAYIRWQAETTPGALLTALQAMAQSIRNMPPRFRELLQEEIAKEQTTAGDRAAVVSGKEPSEAAKVDNAWAGGRCPPGQAGEWVLNCVCSHHGYDGEGVENWEPIGVGQVVTKLEGRVSKGRVSKWFKDAFGGHAEYAGACGRQKNGPLLTKLREQRDEKTTAFVDPSLWLEDRLDD